MDDCKTVDKTREESCRRRIGPLKDENNMLIYDDLEISYTMNSFFTAVGEKLASRFPPTIADKSYMAGTTPTISHVVFDSEEYYNNSS